MRPTIHIPVTSDRRRRPEFRLRASYVRAVLGAGGAPLLVPPIPPADAAGQPRPGGLLLPGGGDVAPSRYGAEDSGAVRLVDPERDEWEIALTRRALEEGWPILAICRGIQLLNVAAGGTLIQDIPTEFPDALCHATPPDRPLHHDAHGVRLLAGSRLACIYGAGDGAALGDASVRVNSRHHQAVRDVAPGLRPTAWAPDGIVEGLETDGPSESPFVVGVQWHPEDLAPRDGATRALFRAFVAAAGGAR